MKTKFWFLVVLTLLLGLVLSACGDSATATSATQATAAPPTSTVAPTPAGLAATAQASTKTIPAVIKMPTQIAGGRPVSITVVGKPLETAADAVAQWNAQVKRFEKLYPNVTIIGSEYTYAPDTFATLVAGKQVPTLFEVYLTDPTSVVNQGIGADVTSFYDASKLRSIYNQNILSLATVNNKIYGIPEFAYGMGLAYNLDMFKEAGIANPPATWTELAADAQKLTKRDAGRSGFSFINDGSNASGWALTTMSYGFGAKPSDLIKSNGNGSYTAAFAKSPLLDTLKYVQNLRWNNNVVPLDTMDWAKNGQTFATGQAAMAVMAGDQFSWMRITYPDVDITKFAFAPLPAGPDGTSTSLIGGNVAMVSSAATDDQKEAAVYYKLWTTFDPDEFKASLDLRQAQSAQTIGTPVLPLYTGSYQQALTDFQKPYNHMPQQNYTAFLDAVTSGKLKLQAEPGPAGQDYYGAVGTALSSILTDKSADPAAALEKAAATFQTNALDRLKK